MIKELNKAFVSSNRGCYSKEQVDSLSFMNKKKETFSITDVIKSEIPLKDKFWFLINKCELTVRQKQDLAISCAEIVVAIYEAKYPNDKAPREAIKAAKDFLNGIITIDILLQKRNEAYKSRRNAADAAADAAAYAADAADAAADAAAYAADAAAAAYAAADAAAYAADAAAAAYAAYAAAYAAARAIVSAEKVSEAIDYTKLLVKLLIGFIKSN